MARRFLFNLFTFVVVWDGTVAFFPGYFARTEKQLQACVSFQSNDKIEN